MKDLKEQLIRLGHEDPSLRKHLTPVLDLLWGRTASTKVTREDLQEMRDVGHKFLTDLAREIESGRGKMIKALEESIRGEAVIIPEIDGSVSGDYSSYDLDRQRITSSIGGTVHAAFTVDSEAKPKKKIVKKKLDVALKGAASGLKAGDFTPEQVQTDVWVDTDREGTHTIQVIFMVWWFV